VPFNIIHLALPKSTQSYFCQFRKKILVLSEHTAIILKQDEHEKNVHLLKCLLVVSRSRMNFVVCGLRPCIPNFKPNIRVGFWVGTSFLQYPKFDFNVIFCNFQKVRNRTNFKLSVSLECSEAPVFDPKTLNNRFFWPNNRVFYPETGNYFRTYFRSVFAKFLRVWKTRIFLKNFRTLKTQLFRNSRKWKVRKISI